MRTTEPLCRRPALAGVLAALLAAHACHAQEPAPVVSDVLVTGNRLVPMQQVFALLRTRAGQPYSEAVVDEDVRNLYASKRFGSVDPRVTPDGPGRVKVCFVFSDQPTRVRDVEYRGREHLTPEELERATGIRPGQPTNPDANRRACQAVVKRLNDLGYLGADCVLVSGGKPNDTRVVFQLTEGHKVAVRGIRFVGNAAVPSRVLAEHIACDGQYNPAAAAGDVARLRNWYHGLGYREASVICQPQLEPDGRNLVLEFQITEGPRSYVPGEVVVPDLPPLPTGLAQPPGAPQPTGRLSPGSGVLPAAFQVDEPGISLVGRVPEYREAPGRRWFRP